MFEFSHSDQYSVGFSLYCSPISLCVCQFTTEKRNRILCTTVIPLTQQAILFSFPGFTLTHWRKFVNILCGVMSDVSGEVHLRWL